MIISAFMSLEAPPTGGRRLHLSISPSHCHDTGFDHVDLRGANPVCRNRNRERTWIILALDGDDWTLLGRFLKTE